MKAKARFLVILFILNTSVFSLPGKASDDFSFTQTQSLIKAFSDKIERQSDSVSAVTKLDSLNIRIEDCQQYPYHENQSGLQMVGFNNSPQTGANILIKDIQKGLQQGLQCLAGKNSEVGKLHPYHERQAERLIELLMSEKTKTFRCVKDKTFAYAIAKLPPNNKRTHGLSDDITKSISYPGVIIDTYRIGGFISDKFNAETYRNFFKLNDDQIKEISNGKPVHLATMHRYKNRSSLMFHEMIHWLGHEHSSIHPDVTELYDTCCFGGSDHISDSAKNKAFQTHACNILKDKELWEANPYKKMQLWKFKEYDQFKRKMRNSYD